MTEEWKRKYREDIAAGENYWRSNPIQWKNAVEHADRNGWNMARDLGDVKQKYAIALSSFSERNETNPLSWYQTRMTEKRKNTPPEAIRPEDKNLFSEL